VTIVKLVKMAEVVPGISLYAFLALIFVLAAVSANLDRHLIWTKWEQAK
jgi:paraquat-inducible protein A